MFLLALNVGVVALLLIVLDISFRCLTDEVTNLILGEMQRPGKIRSDRALLREPGEGQEEH